MALRTPGLKTRIEEIEAEVFDLKNELKDAPTPAPVLHPNLAELYRRKVENLHQALSTPDTRTEAADILRTLIERISVNPVGKGKFELDLTGDIVGMIEMAQTSSRQHKTTRPYRLSLNMGPK